MARYPTFEEYDKRGNYSDGIKRCDDLLAKNANDIQLLTTKLQLLSVTSQHDANALLGEIAALQPPVKDLGEIVAIEQAIIESKSYRTTFPQPLTAGPSAAKLWDNAVKSSTSSSHKLDAISIRFDRAISDNRLLDAQQSLIQLKALQPKNRSIYMAHAALTQMLSTSNEDLQARLAIGLARKAVTERFDEDKSLDCRVPGQIFAMQGSTKDLQGIKDRSFQESQQVFEALREKASGETASKPEVPDPGVVPSHQWLSAELSSLKLHFRSLNEGQASVEATAAFAVSTIRLFLASITSLSAGARRSPADACFLCISALVKLWTLTASSTYLLHAAYLADMLLKSNSHVHEARLILVYLCMRLGLGSSAMRLFDSLSVKEVQHDTIGHTLFTRLSLLHPHPTHFSKRDTFDPSKRLSHALSVYVRCEGKLAETEAGVLTHGQTGMLFDLQELRNNLRTSYSRRVTLLEQRRISRLTQQLNMLGESDNAAKALGSQVVAIWIQANTRDNRDFSAAFDYGFNVERVLHGHAGGNVPGEAWLLFTLASDCVWSLATKRAPLVQDVENLLPELDRLLTSSSPSITEGLDTTDYLAGDVTYHTLKLLVKYPSEVIVQDLTSALHRLNVPLLISTPDALADRLLTHYAYIDVITNLLLAASSLSTSKLSSEQSTQIQSLQDLAQSLLSSLRKHAREQVPRFTKPTAVKAYFSQKDGDAATAAAIYPALREFGEGSIETFCEEVAKSAKEGWEGVDKVGR